MLNYTRCSINNFLEQIIHKNERMSHCSENIVGTSQFYVKL